MYSKLLNLVKSDITAVYYLLNNKQVNLGICTEKFQLIYTSSQYNDVYLKNLYVADKATLINDIKRDETVIDKYENYLRNLINISHDHLSIN
jgi:hypothetical protein